ncbi:TPA: phage tail assembly chaperone [Haemophilus influenzae]
MVKKNGGELPDLIKNKPTLINDGLQFYLQAFFMLESERYPSQYGLMPIPITRIIDYGRYLTISDFEMDDFIYIITALDQATMQYWNSKNATTK